MTGAAKVNIQDAVQKFCDKKGRQKAHVSGETDQLNLVFVENRSDLAVVHFALQAFRRNHARLDSTCFRALDAGCAFAMLMTTAISAFGILPAATLSASASKFEPRPLKSTPMRFFINGKR